MGTLEEESSATGRKASRERLRAAAAELHRCADEMQNVLMRLKSP